MGRVHLAVAIFKMALRWIQKIILMPSERYPNICFQRLLLLDKNSTNIEKYNWISIIKKLFFLSMSELEIWNEPIKFLDPVIPQDLLDTYIDYTRNLDYQASTSLNLYSHLHIDNESNNYLSFIVDFEMKKIFAQFRLLNRFNHCIIVKKEYLNKIMITQVLITVIVIATILYI